MSSRKNHIHFERSSGNVFEDLGLNDPVMHLAKAKLACKIIDQIKRRGMRQADAAKVLGVDQPKVSALKCGRLSGFSLERLIGFLLKLNQDVQINVLDVDSTSQIPGSIRVVV